MNIGGNFAVYPKLDCPHVIKQEEHQVELKNEIKVNESICENCQDATENWICLKCHKIFCSRYVAGHMSQHNQNNQEHCIAISFSDLSVWCYSCSSYISSPVLDNTLKFLAASKFGVDVEEEDN